MNDRSIEKSFGLLLKELRGEANISQEKFAELCDLDRTYISLLERGLRRPTLNTMFKISKSLGIKLSTLMERLEANYEN